MQAHVDVRARGQRAALLVVLATAAAVGAWLLATSLAVSAPGVQGIARQKEQAASVVDGQIASESLALHREPAPDEHGRREETSVLRERAGFVVVQGRCVDVHGAAVPSCAVRLRSGGRCWAEGEDVVTTNAGLAGEFAVKLACGPDLAVARLEMDGFVPVETEAFRLVQSLDLGIVVMERGHSQRGVVSDSRGTPVAGVRVVLSARERRSSPPGAVASLEATTAPGGVFEFPACRRGYYDLSVPGELLEGPRTVEVSEGAPALAIVVRERTRQSRIAGSVCDFRGLPVPHARVLAREVKGARLRFEAVSGDDGTFVVWRTSDVPAVPVALSAIAPGLGLAVTEAAVDWQTVGVQLTLPAAARIEVSVVDRTTQAPVEAFVLRWRHERGSPLAPILPWRAWCRHPDEFHRGGVAAIEGLWNNDWDIVVEPMAPRYAPRRLRVSTGVSAIAAVRCEVSEVTAREVRVVTADGHAVAACALDLCERLECEVSFATKGVSAAELTYGIAKEGCLIVDSDCTDAGGSALLHGAGDRPLVLRVHGPGCVPCIVPVERLGGSDPLVITAQLGGIVHAVASDPDVVGAWSDKAGGGLGLRLQPRQRTTASIPADGTSIPFASTGDVRVQAEPGYWRAVLTHSCGTQELGEIEVRSGAVSEISVDVKALRPAILRGHVVADVDAEPVREVEVQCLISAPNGTSEWRGEHVAVAVDGTFVHRAVAGERRVLVTRALTPSVLEPGRFRLEPGDERHMEFVVSVGRAQLTLLDGGNRPVSDVRMLRLSRPGGDVVGWLQGDREGKVAVTGEVGVFELSVLPRRLHSFEARRELGIRSGGLQVIEQSLIPLGQVIVSYANTTTAVVLPSAYFE